MRKKLLILLSHLIIGGFGASMVLKADIGMAAAWDGLSLSISEVVQVKVGYLSMMFNFICIAVQFVILKKSFHILYLLQVPMAVILGAVINVIYYDFFCLFVLQSYILRLLFALCGFVVMSYAASAIIATDTVSFPLEGMCMVISKTYRVRFGVVRQAVEGCAMILIVLSTQFGGKLTIREGTIIWLLLQGILFDYFLKRNLAE